MDHPPDMTLGEGSDRGSQLVLADDQIARDRQLSSVDGLDESLRDAAARHLAEDPPGEELALAGGHPARVVEGEAARSDEAVDVEVELRGPCVAGPR